MSTFPLKIVTPDGLIYDGEAQRIIVRTREGDMAVMARHINCVAPLGMGRATVVDADGNRRYAACIGGMLSVQNGEVSLVPTTFEWAESIDAARAQLSLERAEKVLSNKDASAADIQLAEARLHRALVRKSVASYE
ncbi:MAG: ATP synthase F1 subunit epsilon [Ruminococcaceae bacterium]|nr:ATP synthase F1 subunit epsilon [Oscillospiraceae bacterium]